MEAKKALYYGQIEIIPNILCDAYVLDDGISVLSELGTADLLEIQHQALQMITDNWPPQLFKRLFLQKFIMLIRRT